MPQARTLDGPGLVPIVEETEAGGGIVIPPGFKVYDAVPEPLF